MFFLKSLEIIYLIIVVNIVIWIIGALLNIRFIREDCYNKNGKNEKIMKKQNMDLYIFIISVLMVYVLFQFVDERFFIVVFEIIACLMGVIGLNRLYWSYLIKKNNDYVVEFVKPTNQVE